MATSLVPLGRRRKRQNPDTDLPPDDFDGRAKTMSPDAVTTVREAISRDATPPTVSVIIPALNEARNLPHVARAMPVDIDEIVVVDGGSKDDTVAVARELWPDAVHIKQTRRGKGNALACGFAAASGDIIVAIDADGSTDPAEIRASSPPSPRARISPRARDSSPAAAATTSPDCAEPATGASTLW